MIGTATSAPPVPAAPAPAPASNPSRMGPSDSAPPGAVAEGSAAAAQDATKSGDGKQSAAANAAGKRDATPEGPAREAEPASDFAGMLAATTEASATAVPSQTPEAPPVDPVIADCSLPDQLLALLSGSWASPSVANVPAATATAAAEARPTQAMPAAAMPFALAATPSAATASSDTPGALPALTELATAALGNADGEPASTPVDAASFDNTLFALTPTPSPLRADATTTVPGPPLTLPDNPDAGFDDGIGARIAWMAEQRVGHAEIRLNPEHVGPIDVRVQLDGTRVSAEFHSAHADVRQAIEASVPRLREMLGQQGLQLGHADVGRGHSGQGQRPAPTRGDSDAEAAGARPSRVAAPVVRSRGLLDEYA